METIVPVISIPATPIVTVVMSMVMPSVAGFDRDADGLSHGTRCGKAADNDSRRYKKSFHGRSSIISSCNKSSRAGFRSRNKLFRHDSMRLSAWQAARCTIMHQQSLGMLRKLAIYKFVVKAGI
jgi:hypothetical protein